MYVETDRTPSKGGGDGNSHKTSGPRKVKVRS